MYVLSTQLSKLDIILGQSTSIQAPKRCCEIAETVENPGSLRRKSCRTATSGLDGLDGCRGRCSFVHNLQWLGVSSFGSTTLASKNGLSGEPILSLHGVGATNRKKKLRHVRNPSQSSHSNQRIKFRRGYPISTHPARRPEQHLFHPVAMATNLAGLGPTGSTRPST